MGVFGLCQLHSFVDYLRSKLNAADFDVLFRALVVATASAAGLVAIILTVTGKYLIDLKKVVQMASNMRPAREMVRVVL